MKHCENRPIFMHFSRECFPCDAYLTIDEYGHIECDYSEEKGTPRKVFEGLHIRFKIDERLTHFEIDNLKERVKPLVKELMNATSIDFVNCSETRVLNDAAINILQNIEQVCNDTVSEDFEKCDNKECSYCNEKEKD